MSVRIFLTKSLTFSTIPDTMLERIKAATEKDQHLQTLTQYTCMGWPSDKRSIKAHVLPYRQIRDIISDITQLRQGSSFSIYTHIGGTKATINDFLMKGAFYKNAPKPKYKCIWDVSIVLNFHTAMGDNASLSLRQISFKRTMLIALITGQRARAIASLSLQSLFFTYAGISVILQELLKTTTPQNRNTQIDLMFYPGKDLCVVMC